MSKLKGLSGKDLIKIFSRLGFETDSQKGSHVKLKRTVNGKKQVLVIPCHKQLDKGTLRAVYRQARYYIPEEYLREYFYTE